MPTRQEKINRIKRILKESRLEHIALNNIEFANKISSVSNSLDKENAFYINVYYYGFLILNKFLWKIDLKEVS